MKPITIFIVSIMFVLNACAQKQSFDIVTYTSPKSWSISEKPETLTFTKEEGNRFCMITIYKSIDATTDAQQNFDMAWQSLVKENLGVNVKAEMQPGSTDNGWETKIGSAPFDKEGIKGAAILISSSNNGKLLNILSITNTDAYQKEMEVFLESVDMKQATAPTIPKAPSASNNTSLNPEVWMVYRYSLTKAKYDAQWLVIYPNGDCLNYIPDEGLLNFKKAADDKDHHQFWGVKKDKGREIHITFGNGTEMKLGKISATEMSYPPGSAISVYKKCNPVDGLRLEGEWSTGGVNGDPKWYNIAGFKDGVIEFRKDGTFDNRGIYTKKGSVPSQLVYRESGKGTYYIKDFTLVLTYSDGEIFKVPFTGFKSENPLTNNEVLFIWEVPFYKNLRKK